MDVKLQAAVVVFCALVMCDVCWGWHRAPASGIRIPNKRQLMTWDTYANKVAGTTLSEIYLLPILSSFPSDLLRYEPSPMRNGNDVFLPFHLRDETGTCRTEAFYEWNTNFTHAAGEKYAILRSGAQMDVYFSDDPDSYVFFIQCFDVSTIVRGVCTGDGLLSFEVRNFPPNQLNWWRVVWNLKRVMGLTFLDPRFFFVAGAEGCPAKSEAPV